GWIMDDWQDTDAILDQLITILSPEHREELDRAGSLAAGASRWSVEDMAAATAALYRTALEHGKLQSVSRATEGLARLRAASELSLRGARVVRPPAPSTQVRLPGRNDKC